AHKTANYLECALGTREAAARGAEEGLFTDAAGNYLEGCTTNLFAVAEGALWTAEAGVLPGVARAIALEAAAEAGMTVRPGAIPGAVLREAEELFLTNSVIEVAGVVELDGRALAGGDIGSVTRRIAAAYRARVEAEREASFPRA
ncbi:MAG: aminotransferase class IV, partial [Candidatus Methylomirabilis sp.]|nr:aminotransferase class IV [Deltaproteobacteria bacterium]